MTTLVFKLKESDMYKFVIKNIKGDALYESAVSFEEVISAQLAGVQFMVISNTMGRNEMSVKGNYIDIVSVEKEIC